MSDKTLPFLLFRKPYLSVVLRENLNHGKTFSFGIWRVLLSRVSTSPMERLEGDRKTTLTMMEVQEGKDTVFIDTSVETNSGLVRFINNTDKSFAANCRMKKVNDDEGRPHCIFLATRVFFPGQFYFSNCRTMLCNVFFSKFLPSNWISDILVATKKVKRKDSFVTQALESFLCHSIRSFSVYLPPIALRNQWKCSNENRLNLALYTFILETDFILAVWNSHTNFIQIMFLDEATLNFVALKLNEQTSTDR